MDKKELIRALIDLAHSEGSNVEFDHQFGHDGFVDANGEFWATDGYSVVEICNKIQNACMEELLQPLDQEKKFEEKYPILASLFESDNKQERYYILLDELF